MGVSTVVLRLCTLQVLDLSTNCISRLEGLSCLPRLHTLLVADNRLRATEDVQHLASCPKIHELSLAENHLHEPAGLLDVLSRLPQLEARATPAQSELERKRGTK